LNVNWWGPDVIGIDEGPIVLMIENYRTGKVWQRFMRNADIQRGLQKAGFTIVNAVDETPHALPTVYQLFQNYPNPFNPQTTIRFALPRREHARLKVFDVLGKQVALLVDETLERGNHARAFDGRALPSGIYFYALTAQSFTQTRKAVLIR